MIKTQFLDILLIGMNGWHFLWCFQPSDVGKKKIPHHHFIPWLITKILFSNVLEQELLYQRYIGLHERSKLSQILLCRSLWSWYKLRIISLLVHNSQNYQNHKSLELGIVVKRIVLAFVLFCFCFVVVVVVHLLFSKVVIHLHTLLL